jgi:DNA-binding Lrp family transcriptional regulator
MRSNHKLDKTDIKIIQELSQNPQSTLTDIAANTKISRPTITTHLKTLSDSGFLIYEAGLSLKNMGFLTALVALEVKQEQSRIATESYLSHCPRVTHLFRTPGKANLHVFCWGENDRTLTATINTFRNMPNTEVISTLYLGQPIFGDCIIDISKEMSKESPCGKLICSECRTYINGDCLGCPSTEDYKGPLKVD